MSIESSVLSRTRALTRPRDRQNGMKHHWASGLAIIFAILGGCHSALTWSGDAPVNALSGPYQLRLVLDRASAFPGNHVYALIEFENTGNDVLWIPRRSEI